MKDEEEPLTNRHYHWLSLLAAILFWSSQLAAATPKQLVRTPTAGQVTVYRDDWGVPHIYAAREEDGYFGFGYSQAEDQLESVLVLFLAAEGKATEVLQSGETTVGAEATGSRDELFQLDRYSRQWRHAEEAKKAVDRLSPQLRKNDLSYLAGIKRYMQDHPKQVPQWAPDLQLWNVVAFTRFILWDYMIFSGISDCQRGGVKLSSTMHRAMDATSNFASNEWLVAPARTADRAMIVLSDPHGEVDGEIFYEFGMHAGSMHVAGYALGPLFLLTHNRDLSWGQTTGAPDVSDCYEVDVDPKNPRRYLYDGKWKTMEVRDFTLQIKGKDPIKEVYEYTDHNGTSAVVARQGDKAYVISTSYMDAAGLFDQEVYDLNKAHNVREFRDALKTLGMYPQNLMVGDRFGNSYYVRIGRTPIRPPGVDPTRPLPGNTSASAWRGLHPPEDLVQVENPPQGYMQNNNAPPSIMVQDGNLIQPSQYPSYIYNDVEHFRYVSRAMRVNEVLSKATNFSLDDAIALSLDEKWFGTELWQRALTRALEMVPTTDKNDEFQRFSHRLASFDGYARADSIAALDYFYWRTALLPDYQGAQGNDLIQALQGHNMTSSAASAFIRAIDGAIEMMHTKHGSIDTPYGDVFRISRNGKKTWALGGGSSVQLKSYTDCRDLEQPVSACSLTTRAYQFGALDANGRRMASSGSRALRLVSFTDPLRSFTLHNYGQSSHPESPHYDDQAQRLASGQILKSTYFNDDELAHHIESVKTLRVAPQ